VKIALPGTNGKVGTRALAELLRHGHEVTGIARNPKKVAPQPKLALNRGNVKNEAELAKMFSGHDAVIHSLRFQSTNPHKVFAATKRARVKRPVIVGDAGTLEVAPGAQRTRLTFLEFTKPRHWQHATSLTHCEMKRTRLDVPLPIGALLSRETDWKISPGRQPIARRREQREQTLNGTFRRCAGR
jgi:putative NADH-flavin reductase